MGKRARRRLVVVVALLCVGAGAVIAFKRLHSLQQQRIVAEAQAEGLAAYEEGDYEKALDKLRLYIAHRKDEPEVLDTLLKFADARRRTALPGGEHLPEAMNLYLHARKLLHDNPEIDNRAQLRRKLRSDLLEVYVLLGMRPELIATAESILREDPDNTDAHAARANALIVSQRYAEASESISRLIELEPEQMAWRHLALQNMRGLQRSDRELLDQCDQWIEQWEGDGRLRVLKAGWLEEMGRSAEARAEAIQAANEGAGSLQVLQHLVSLLDLLGLPEQANAALEEARIRFEGEQWVAEAKARRAWNAGDLGGALKEIEQAEQDFEGLERGLVKLKASLLLAAGRNDEVRPALARLRQVADDRESRLAAEAWSDAMEAWLSLDDVSWHRTVDACRSAIAANPEDAMLRFLLGDAYSRVGERAMAVAQYERAVSLEPNWIAARAALAEALLAAGQPDAAYRASRSLIQRSPTNRYELYVLLSRSYIASILAGGDPVLLEAGTSRPIDIVVMLQAMHDQSPAHPATAAMLAEACCLTGRTGRAQRLIDESLSSDHSGGEMLLALAEVSSRYGLERRGELIAEARRREGLTIPVALAEASILREEGRVEEGLDRIDDSIAAAEDGAAISAGRRGRASYLLQVEHPEALDALRELVASERGSVESQVFALSQPAAWRDRRLVRSSIDELATILGPYSPHVRIAEANYLLQFHSGDEAKRAEAMTMLSEVLAQSPLSVPALILLSQAWRTGERPSPDRAITYLKRAVDAAPARRQLYVELVALLQAQGDYDTAGRYLQRLSRLPDPGRDGMRREIHLLEAQGDFETALLRANRLVNEDADATDQLALAALHLRVGDYDAAEEIYARLLARDGSHELVVAQAAEFYRSTGQPARGLDLLHSLPQGPRRSLMIGQFLHRNGRHDEAEQWLMEVLEEDPQLVEARHQLARLYLATSRPQLARDQALSGLETNPDHAGLRGMLASANLELGKAGQEDAIRLLREIGRDNDSLIATLQLLERVPRKDGKPVPTYRNLTDAEALVQAHPHFMPAWMLAVTLHTDAKKHREAIDLARRAVSRFPASPEPAEWAARLLIETGNYRQALVEAQEWRRRTLHDPLQVDVIVASILLELDRPDDAVAQIASHAERFVAEASAAPGPMGVWIRSLVQAGQVKRAWNTVRPRAEEDALWLDGWLTLAENSSSEIAFEMLAAAQPFMLDRSAEATMELARAWVALGKRQGDPEGFERAADAVEQINPEEDQRVAWMFLNGRIAEGLGDLEEAERWYREVLAAMPDHAAALNNIAFVLTRLSGRGEEAVIFAERALSKEPEHPDLLDTYAHALLAAGRPDEANDAVQRALAQRPDDIGLSLSLAEVLFARQSYGEASEVLDRARQRMERQKAAEPALWRRADDLRRQLSQFQVSVEP